MDMTQISKVRISSADRPSEPCVIWSPGDTKCLVCGRDPGYLANSCHPGPEITVFGSFEMAEYHDLLSAIFNGLRLSDLGETLDAEQEGLAAIPIAVVECEPIEPSGWRYEFKGGMFVEVPRIPVESP